MSDEKLKLKIEKSPTKKYNSKSTFVNNTFRDKRVSIIGCEKNHSLNNIKLYAFQDSITNTSKLKSTVEIKKTYDNIQTLKPILKHIDISPVKIIKRLKTQGALRKLKNVYFKSQIVEYKEVESLSKITNNMKKNIRQNGKVQSYCTSCNCIVF